jgi:CRP-like cAMP-binding protein
MFDLTRARAHPSFDSHQILEDLYRNQNTIPVKSGHFIPMKTEDIFIVYRGLVKLNTLSPCGDEQTIGLAHPSMPFGLPLTKLNLYEAVALTDVLLVRIDQNQIDKSPMLIQSLLREITRRLQQTEALLAIAGERLIEDRLRLLLQFLGEEIGQEMEQGVRLSVRLTQEQIASLAVTTRVTVTRTFIQFRKEGWLEVDANRHLVIRNSSGLQASAA